MLLMVRQDAEAASWTALVERSRVECVDWMPKSRAGEAGTGAWGSGEGGMELEGGRMISCA
jgi:hypothetical protein